MSMQNSFNKHGSGAQNAVTGDGSQYNNNGDGVQHNYYGTVNIDHQTDGMKGLREEKNGCLRSLGFSNIDARRHDIEPAHPGTCDWLFETIEFQEWQNRTDLRAHNGVLWIKGKPGSGKSTLMKHTLLHCQSSLKDHLIVAYFFNARGNMLEKTPMGMLRSILYQLLIEDDTIYQHFAPIFNRRKRYSNEDWEWKQSELKDILHSIMQKTLSKPLILLVDALDECIEEDVRDVVSFLGSLSAKSADSGVSLSICLSSRHYPHVSMSRKLELTVETSQEHAEDIAKYIGEKLSIQDDQIVADLQKKADGVFMWVVIVVGLLNKAYDEGREEAMKEALEDVPTDLEKVFEMLLGEDNEQRAETLLMLQWVLFSKRPLTPEELFAVTIGTAHPTSETIHRRITTSSKGLIEIRKGDETSVQFIHLSVSDFLLRNRKLQTLDPTLDPDPIATSHGRLWNYCRIQLEGWKGDNPFFEYALIHIFDHADRALSGSGIKRRWKYWSMSFPSLFNDAPPMNQQRKAIEQWLRDHHKWFQLWKSYLRPLKRIHKYRRIADRDSAAGLLYMLSLCGHQHLVRVVLGQAASLNAQGGHYGNALQAAANGENMEIVKLLLENGANIHMQGGLYGNALQAAASGKAMEIVRLLLEKGADINIQGGHYGTALQAAAAHGSMEMVKLLLEKGANINIQGGCYGTAFRAAVENMNIEIVKLLLKNGADIHIQGGYYGNALQAAVSFGRMETVELLLENGADIHIQGGHYGNALQAAASHGRIEIVKLLLDDGADINKQGGFFGNALQAAAYGKKMEIVKLLLEKGADINTQGGLYGTALQAASSYGNMDVVELLLERGADINIQGGHFRNALHAARSNNHTGIASLLVENGASDELQEVTDTPPDESAEF